MTTTVELDLRTLLNEPPSIPCEDQRCETGLPARWRWVGWCGCGYLVCDQCAGEIGQWLRVKGRLVADCSECGAVYDGLHARCGRLVPFG